MSTSGGCVCPTKNWTRSLTHLPFPYLYVMKWCITLTQKQILLLLWTWTVIIGKYWQNSRHAKYWNSSPQTEISGGK